MSKLNKFNIGWFKKAASSLLMFGKNNATSFMNGGSILLGWLGVYIFWTEALKAEEFIKKQQELIPVDNPEDKKFDKKDKLLIYAKFCWPSALMGLASTGLSLYSHKLDLDQIAKAYVLTQFYKDKNEKNEDLIEKLKAEIKPSKVEEIEKEQTKGELKKKLSDGTPIVNTGKGNTLFVSDYGNIKFRSSVTEVNKGFYRFKTWLRDMRNIELKRYFADPFMSTDNPYANPDDLDIYSSADLDDFFECLGVSGTKFGTLLEVRDYGNDNYFTYSDVFDYSKDFEDPDTGEPTVCYIRIEKFLCGTHELIERNP